MFEFSLEGWAGEQEAGGRVCHAEGDVSKCWPCWKDGGKCQVCAECVCVCVCGMVADEARIRF